ncbi:MAG: GNAT family N-acetyltransferase [Sterolibacterium sp.]
MLQLERWATFYPECIALFDAHNTEVGESPTDMPFDPDIDSIAALDAADQLQIVTARKDGKLVGYCMFTIGNSLQSKGVLCGTQAAYYLKKENRPSGLGIKLYLESLTHLKARGVKNVYPHHWLRGDSPKLKTFFERIGAVELEHVYSLWIGN